MEKSVIFSIAIVEKDSGEKSTLSSSFCRFKKYGKEETIMIPMAERFIVSSNDKSFREIVKFEINTILDECMDEYLKSKNDSRTRIIKK